jgi:hypothetical protein
LFLSENKSGIHECKHYKAAVEKEEWDGLAFYAVDQKVPTIDPINQNMWSFNDHIYNKNLFNQHISVPNT